MADNVNEFDICWGRGDKVAGVTCPNASAMKSKIIKLSLEHSDEVEIVAENKDGSILAHVPVKCVAIRWPKQISEEQAAAAGERLSKSRRNKSNMEEH